MRTSVAAGLGLLLIAAMAGAQGAKSSTREAFRWSGKLAAGQTLVLRGVSGDVRVEAAAGAEVEVVGIERRSAAAAADAKVTVQQVTGKAGMAFCAVFPDTDTRCEADGGYRVKGKGKHGGGGDGLVLDFVVKVPKGVVVSASTINGEVSVRGATAAVDAASVQGDVVAESSGAPVTGASVNGSVRVRGGAGGDLSATSVNGDVTIVAPAALDADVDGSTVNGTVQNDFGLPVEKKIAHQGMRGSVGKGRHRVHLNTVNGQVALKKQ